MNIVRGLLSLVAVVTLTACAGADAKTDKKSMVANVYSSDDVGKYNFNAGTIIFEKDTIVILYYDGGSFVVDWRSISLTGRYQVEVGSSGDARFKSLTERWQLVKGGHLSGSRFIGIVVTIRKGEEEARCLAVASPSWFSSGLVVDCGY